MPEPTLTERVDILEQKVQLLASLPARVTAVEVQILHLRSEMQAAFSALGEELQLEIRAGDEETRRHMRVLHEEVISRIASLQE